MEMMKSEQAKEFVFVGGDLSLNFTNTTANIISETPSERIHNYDDLTAWGRQAGILSDAEATRLVDQAAGEPKKAGAVLKRALTLRDASFRIFAAVAQGKKPAGSDLDVLNRELAAAMQRAEILAGKDGFEWDWTGVELDSVLWRVARAAAELLTSGKLDRVRQCGDEVCGWLFLDMSKNRSRRWCAMGDCGNIHKSRRFRARLNN